MVPTDTDADAIGGEMPSEDARPPFRGSETGYTAENNEGFLSLEVLCECVRVRIRDIVTCGSVHPDPWERLKRPYVQSSDLDDIVQWVSCGGTLLGTDATPATALEGFLYHRSDFQVPFWFLSDDERARPLHIGALSDPDYAHPSQETLCQAAWDAHTKTFCVYDALLVANVDVRRSPLLDRLGALERNGLFDGSKIPPSPPFALALASFRRVDREALTSSLKAWRFWRQWESIPRDRRPVGTEIDRAGSLVLCLAGDYCRGNRDGWLFWPREEQEAILRVQDAGGLRERTGCTTCASARDRSGVERAVAHLADLDDRRPEPGALWYCKWMRGCIWTPVRPAELWDTSDTVERMTEIGTYANHPITSDALIEALNTCSIDWEPVDSAN